MADAKSRVGISFTNLLLRASKTIAIKPVPLVPYLKEPRSSITSAGVFYVEGLPFISCAALPVPLHRKYPEIPGGWCSGMTAHSRTRFTKDL
jgi:hypothetical protein